MEEPLFEKPDIEAAAVTFLYEFCDLFIPRDDMIVLAMYRAHNEIKRLREKKHEDDSISKLVDNFEQQLNEHIIHELKQENYKLKMSLLRINKNLGKGSEN